MEIKIITKLIFIITITVFLLIKKEKMRVNSFPQQPWSIREILPIYWIFVLLSIVIIFVYNKYPSERFHFYTPFISTFLAGFILFIAARKLTGRGKKISLKIIGGKNSDLLWLIILLVFQYCILFVFIFSNNFAKNQSHMLLLLLSFSIILGFGPAIETILYLGMMFIPTIRAVGILQSAILISSLQALSHLNYGIAEVAMNFAVFGLLGCYLYIKSKRIIVPLVMHSSINFLVLLRDLKFL